MCGVTTPWPRSGLPRASKSDARHFFYEALLLVYGFIYRPIHVSSVIILRLLDRSENAGIRRRRDRSQHQSLRQFLSVRLRRLANVESRAKRSIALGAIRCSPGAQ